MTELTVEAEFHDDGTSRASLTVRGDLDHDNAEDFLDTVRAVLPNLTAAGGRVLIDCADVDSCDYSGLSALLMARREAGEAGARLVLVRQSPQLAALLSVAGVSDLLSAPEEGAGESQDPSQDRSQGPSQVGSHGSSQGSEPAPVALEWAGAVPVITLTGQIDLDCIEELTGAFAEAAAGARGGRTVVDVSGMDFADSTMLHLLLKARAESDLVLVGPLRSQVHLLFQVTDLLDAFHFAGDLVQALTTLDRAL